MELMLYLLMAILGLLFIFTSQYLFEKNGINYIYIIYDILSFILSFKIIEVLKIDINANIIISSLFTGLTYIIIEKNNTKDYKGIIKNIFIINIFTSILILLLSSYIGTVTDLNTINIWQVFFSNYKIIISYPLITLITQIIIFLIYTSLKEDIKNISNRIVITNLTALMIESTLFNIFSYIFEIPFSDIFLLIVSNYIIKVIMTTLYIPITTSLIKLKKVKS